MCMKKLESTQNKLLPKFMRTNVFGGRSKGGGAEPKTAQDYYEERKVDYGPLPSLRNLRADMGSTSTRLKDAPMPETRSGGGQVRTLLNIGPYK